MPYSCNLRRDILHRILIVGPELADPDVSLLGCEPGAVELVVIVVGVHLEDHSGGNLLPFKGIMVCFVHEEM